MREVGASPKPAGSEMCESKKMLVFNHWTDPRLCGLTQGWGAGAAVALQGP